MKKKLDVTKLDTSPPWLFRAEAKDENGITLTPPSGTPLHGDGREASRAAAREEGPRVRYPAAHSHANRGQSLAEMALVLPILVLLLMGILEVGRVLDAWIVVTNAAREGARYAAVGRPAAEVSQRTRDYLTQGFAGRGDVGQPADWTITVTNAQGIPGTEVSVGARVKLTVFTPLFQGIMKDSSFPVGRTVKMQMQ